MMLGRLAGDGGEMIPTGQRWFTSFWTWCWAVLSYPVSLSIERPLPRHLALPCSTLPSTSLSSPASIVNSLSTSVMSLCLGLFWSLSLRNPPFPYPQPSPSSVMTYFILSFSFYASFYSFWITDLINIHIHINIHTPTVVCESVKHRSEINGLPAMQCSASVVTHTHTHSHTHTLPTPPFLTVRLVRNLTGDMLRSWSTSYIQGVFLVYSWLM